MGDNNHKEKYESIPSFINNSICEIHLEPCYKKYTLILSKDSNSTILHQWLSRSLSRLSLTPPENPRLLIYSKECSLCKKLQKGEWKNYKTKINYKTHGWKYHKSSTKAKNIPLFAEIKDSNLAVKEFIYHKKYYQEFIFGFS